MKFNITLLVLLSVYMSFSQEQVEGEIIISRENLISLLQKFKSKKIETQSQATTFHPRNSIISSSSDIDSIQEKIIYLEKNIVLLNRKIDSLPKTHVFKDTIFIANEKISEARISKKDTLVKYITRIDTVYINERNQTRFVPQSTVATNKNYDEELKKLNKKFDLLLAAQGTNLLLTASNKREIKKEQKATRKNEADIQPEKVATENPSEINNDLTPANLLPIADDSKKVVASIPELTNDVIVPIPIIKKEKKDESTVSKTPVEMSEYQTLKSTYGNVKEQVYFGNNSTEIRSTDSATLFEIMTIINKNPTVDIYLEGFASKKGNPTYNEQLSLKRTEVVKQYLISKGIHPTRISSHYFGIDHNAKSEAVARRVDISFVVRK